MSIKEVYKNSHIFKFINKMISAHFRRRLKNKNLQYYVQIVSVALFITDLAPSFIVQL